MSALKQAAADVRHSAPAFGYRRPCNRPPTGRPTATGRPRPHRNLPLEAQARNPLHGITLERLLTELVEQVGWETLGREIDIRCFTHDPGIASSLKFLRRTPWARAKVESYYLYIQRQNARQAKDKQ